MIFVVKRISFHARASAGISGGLPHLMQFTDVDCISSVYRFAVYRKGITVLSVTIIPLDYDDFVKTK